MMSSENSKTDEIRKIILSLLLSRKGLTPLAILDRDYYDMERKRIPWRKFGYNDLAAFLRSMPEHFEVEWHNGCHYVRGIASEKSKHVSSLVARQKSDLKTRNFRSRLYRPVSRYVPHMQRQRIMLPVEQLHLLVQYIRNYPDGVSMQTIMMVLQQQQPQVVLSVHDVRQQLRELSHQLTMDGEMVYPVLPNNVPQEAKKPPMPAPQTRPEYQDYQAGAICVAGDEDWVEEYNSDVYLLAGYESSNHAAQLQMTSERLAANFMQNMSHKQMCEQQNDYDNNRNADDYFTANIKHSNVVLPKDEAPSDRYSDISTLISDRAKSRLEQLIAKHPEGIPCAKLPDMYLSEYKVRLNYTELGFSSVREYVSYLPNIFYMTRVNATDDFVLYSANKKPTIPDQQTGSQTAESVGTRTNFAKRYEEQVRIKCSDEAIPTDVSPSITSKFAPDDVMNHNDRIDFISVTDLQCNEHLEVYIAEVFTPSFFWIHLRESNKPLRLIMDNLQLFYESNSEAYAIPKVALSKGLNCACIFARRWHRAVIKSVKPDFRVTVMFYDYGTLKTYQSEEVYYLHKQFSHLPAQAIPCGLYNVKPCVGDRWKKSVTEQFMDKVSDYLLDATVMSIDPMHNSMMVILTDTSEEEHVNINDWLVNQNLARQGKLGNAVDMTNLMKYVLNFTGQLPLYCYAEENLVADYCSKTTSTKQMHEVPLVSPGQTLLQCCNPEQQPTVKPPPGFLPLDLPNIYSLGNTSSFGKAETTTNPFLDDPLPDTIPTDGVKQIFAQTWKENTQLQVKLSRFFYNLLECLSIKRDTFDSYIKQQRQVNSILKNMEKEFILAADDGFVSPRPMAPTSNLVNEMTPRPISKTSFHPNDEFAAAAPSSLPNLFSGNSSTSQAALFNTAHYDVNNFAFKNWRQPVDEFNPRVQVPSQAAVNPMPAIPSNYGAATGSTFQKTDHENKHVPSMKPRRTNTVSSSSSSGFFSTKSDVYNDVPKETNPFRLSMIGEIQIPDTPSEQRVNNNYNPNTAYLSTINLQNYTTNVEPANVYPKTDAFLYACDVKNGNYTPRIVYEAGPVMYNVQKKEANANMTQSAYCNNFDNSQVSSFLLKQCNEEFPSQLVTNMAALSLNSAHLDEGYVTRPSTTHNPQDSPSMINDEPKYYQTDVNSPSVLAQPWKKVEIPERWVNSQFENNAFTPTYNNNAIKVSTLVDVSSHQTYDNKKEPTPREHLDNINESCQDNDDEKLMDKYRYS
ncbi:uncharacterized protein LOC105285145 isoform X2 [Ooceraea biroi]|uniref:uncharacterized protein LOC105285145 isoform X2 n=1 Tax=Ooceraea biroi TaxID=2015173 RepID=UPI0005BC9325|nr:uncharacterized protein LOC105285145 isoform X2 [Ooceraea biroi]